MTFGEIAEEAGISRETLRKRLRSSGITAERPGPLGSAELCSREQLEFLSELGCSVAEMAVALGVSERTISRYRAEHGLAPRHPVRVKLPKRRVLQMHRQGLGAREIGQVLGCSARPVWDLLADLGVARNGGAQRAQLGVSDRQIAREYAKGISLGELGRRYGRSRAAVRTAVLAGGGTIRPRGPVARRS
jgi:DNA-binding CsgD family transcriptional regulator